MTMYRVYVSIGTNLEREHHVHVAARYLEQTFEDVVFSSVYACQAVGFDGPEFYNLAAGFTALMPLEDVMASLRELELANGRPVDAQKYTSRTLDIDIVWVDGLQGQISLAGGKTLMLPRPEWLVQAHMLAPMAELLPALIPAGEHRSLAALWQAYSVPAGFRKEEWAW